MLRFFTKQTIIIILLIITLMVCLANFGRTVQPPYPLSFSASNEEVYTEKNGNTYFKEGLGGVTLDSGFTRAIFLNKDKEAVSYEESGFFDDTIKYYSDVSLDDKYVYLLSYDRYIETTYVKSQRIDQYDYDGNLVSTIWEKDYDGLESKITNPRIFSFDNNQESIYAIYVDENESYVDVYDVSNKNETPIAHFDTAIKGEIFSAEYNRKSNSLGILSDLGRLQLYKDNKLIYSKAGLDPKISYIQIDDDGTYKLAEKNPKSILFFENIDFSPKLIFKTLAFWASITYVLVLGLVVLIRFLRRLVKEKKIKNIARGALVTVAIFAILGMSLYYSVSIYQNSISNRINVLTISAKNTKTFIEEELTSEPEKLRTDESYLKIKEKLYALRLNNSNSKFSVDYVLLYHENKNFLDGEIIASTVPGDRPGRYYYADEDIEIFDESSPDDDFYVYSIQGDKGQVLLAQQGVRDINGDLSFSVSAFYDEMMASSKMLIDIAKLFVNLLVVIITIVLLFVEIGAVYSACKFRNRLQKRKVKNPEIAFSRTFFFLFTFVTSIDGALMVLIAKDIATNNDMMGGTFLLGIPPTCLTLGISLGTPVFNSLSKRLNIRTIIASCGILLAISLFLTFYFVSISNFYGYCFGILANGIISGVFCGAKFYMPLLSPDNETRFKINRDFSLAGISANVLAVGIAGLIAEFLGSEYIYLMAIIPALMFFVLAVFIFPKNMKYYVEVKKSKTAKLKDNLKFLFSPSFLAFALFMLMTDTLATGYKSFLFPLFTSDAGISKGMISNYVIFANFLAFAINRHAAKQVKKTDFLYLSIFCTVVTGLTFVSFLINDTVAWSIAVIAIVVVVSKVSTICNDMLWPRLCKSKNFPEQSCNKMIKYFNDISYTVRSMILSALATMGVIAACTWMGVFMIVGAFIFLVLAKKTKYFNPPEKK